MGPRLRLGEGRARHALPHGRGSAHPADAALAQRQCLRSERHHHGAARVAAHAFCRSVHRQARRRTERNGPDEELRVFPARGFVCGHGAGRSGHKGVQAFGHRISARRAPHGKVQDRVSGGPAQGRGQGRKEGGNGGKGVRRKTGNRAAQGICDRECRRARRGQRFHQRRRGGADPGDIRAADRDPAQRQPRFRAGAGGPVRRRPRAHQSAQPRERRAALHRDPRHGGEGAAGLPRQDQGAGGQPRPDAGEVERAAKGQGAGRGGDSHRRAAERAREFSQEGRGDAPGAERGPPRAEPQAVLYRACRVGGPRRAGCRRRLVRALGLDERRFARRAEGDSGPALERGRRDRDPGFLGRAAPRPRRVRLERARACRVRGRHGSYRRAAGEARRIEDRAERAPAGEPAHPPGARGAERQLGGRGDGDRAEGRQGRLARAPPSRKEDRERFAGRLIAFARRGKSNPSPISGWSRISSGPMARGRFRRPRTEGRAGA